MLNHNVAIIVGFDLVWFACAFGAASGSNAPGVIAAVGFVFVCLWRRKWEKREAWLLLTSALAGIVAESVFASSGLVAYEAAMFGPSLAPPWIIALWLAFGATLTPAAELLGARATQKAAALGVLFGPLAYVAGSSLGALHMRGEPWWLAYAVIAAVWVIAYPALIGLKTWLAAQRK